MIPLTPRERDWILNLLRAHHESSDGTVEDLRERGTFGWGGGTARIDDGDGAGSPSAWYQCTRWGITLTRSPRIAGAAGPSCLTGMSWPQIHRAFEAASQLDLFAEDADA